MILANFLHYLTNGYDPEFDQDLVKELAKELNCSPEEIYFIGDDSGLLPECGDGDPYHVEVSYYLQTLMGDNPICVSGDGYVFYYKIGDVKVALTNSHGYCNIYVAKNDIAKIPSLPGDQYGG
jgi:hypothetical protein